MADFGEKQGLAEHAVQIGVSGAGSFENLHGLTAEEAVLHAIDLSERALAEETFHGVGIATICPAERIGTQWPF